MRSFPPSLIFADTFTVSPISNFGASFLMFSADIISSILLISVSLLLYSSLEMEFPEALNRSGNLF